VQGMPTAQLENGSALKFRGQRKNLRDS